MVIFAGPKNFCVLDFCHDGSFWTVVLCDLPAPSYTRFSRCRICNYAFLYIEHSITMAAALLDGDRTARKGEEERFTRKKHDVPKHAIEYCLEEGGLAFDDIDHIAFYDKPFLKFERLLETYVAFAPRGFKSFRVAIPLWLREKLFQKNLLGTELGLMSQDGGSSASKLLFSEHHLSHAASAFYPSPFEEAIVLTMDGVGEWATTSVAHGKGNKLEVLREIHFPHSIGLLYSAITYYTGFKVNSGEYADGFGTIWHAKI